MTRGRALLVPLVLALACDGEGAPGVPATDGGPRVDAASGSDPFIDVTRSAGVDLDRVPAEDWRELPDRFSGGVCVLDADGAPPLDLFFAMRPGAGGGSRLYVGRAPLRYADETSRRGLADVGDAVGCLAFDADGDADDDLLVTGVGGLRLFLQDGDRFEDATDSIDRTFDGADVLTSAAAADLDGDADLDLVVGGFMRWERPENTSRCRTAGCGGDVFMQDPIPSVLLRRTSGGRYVDATSELAPDLAREEPTLTVLATDLDADGLVDVFVGNDLGFAHPDRPLVRDADGTFGDAAETLGMAYDAHGTGTDTMGAARGDLDRDGRLDLLVTSFARDATVAHLCGEDGFCADRAEQTGLASTAASFRWGIAAVDLDLDGWLDVVEATGHVLTDSEAAAAGHAETRDQPSNVLLADAGGSFALLERGDALSEPLSSRGIAIVDLDDDGRMDVVLAPSIGPPALLHNRLPREGHWLRVVLRGPPPNTRGVGALVRVHTAEGVLLRERRAGEGYLGSFDPRLHFGIADDVPVDVEVRWPDGEVTRLEEVGVDAEVVVDAMR